MANYNLIKIDNIKFDVDPTMYFVVPTIWTRPKYEEELVCAFRSWIIDVLTIHYDVEAISELPEKFTVTQFKQPFDEDMAHSIVGHTVHCDDDVSPMSQVNFTVEYPTEVYALIPSNNRDIRHAARRWMENYLQIKLEVINNESYQR